MTTNTGLADCELAENIQLSVSVICLHQAKLEQLITEVLARGVRRLHVDFIDDTFGGLGLPREALSDLRASFNVPIDVHLMVKNPERALDWVVADGADCVMVHQRNLTQTLIPHLRSVQESGVGVGLVLNPGEPPREDAVDQIGATRLTAMSVEPGGAGRPFDRRALSTLRQARALVGQTSISEVEADGAVGPETMPLLRAAGADIFVVGSTVLPNRTMTGCRLEEMHCLTGN